MTTERNNSGIDGTNEEEIGYVDAGRAAPDESRLPVRSHAVPRGGKSPQWAWAVCRSEFDWMDVHLPFFTSEWF
jgi:hypothetical protein